MQQGAVEPEAAHRVGLGEEPGLALGRLRVEAGEVDERQREARAGEGHLRELAAARHEGRAQRLVT